MKKLLNWFLKNRTLSLLLLVILIAVFFRFFYLSQTPPGLYPDIATNGTDAIHANETGNYAVFYQANNGREGLFINLIAASFKIFGTSVWSMRAVSALIGVLTVLGLYFFASELFGKRVGLLASFFMATSFWAVNFSRMGFRAIMVPLILVWSSFFLFRGLRTKKFLDWALAGAIFALGFYTYLSFRLAPVILLIFFGLYLLIDRGFIKTYWKQIVVFGILGLIVLLPFLNYFYQNPADFSSRSGGLSVFSPEVNKGNLLGTLAATTAKAFGMFNFYGDPNWRHNIPGWPELNLFVGLGFLGGIFLAGQGAWQFFKKKKESLKYIFLFLIFGVMLLPTIITEEGSPHSLRAIGVLAVVFIFSAIFFDLLLSQVKKKEFKKAFWVILALILLLDLSQYFLVWGRSPQVSGAFDKNLVNIGEYLNSQPKEEKKMVIVNYSGVEVDGMPVPVQTVKFITYQKADNVSYVLPKDIEETVPDTFVFMRYDDKIIKELEQKYPSGKSERIDLYPNTNSEFFIYKLKKF